MLQQIRANLYRITVALGNNPLKSLNSYVLLGGKRNLIIDTGFNLPECLADLSDGIRRLGLDMNKTDIFVTHFHADHCGLVSQIMAPGTRVYMGRQDYRSFCDMMEMMDDYWLSIGKGYRQEGYPEQEMLKTQDANPAKKYMSTSGFEAIQLEDGDTFDAGGEHLQAVWTPGHTPGHMCLYIPAKKVLFTGDHLLYDITPNITVWDDLPNALKHYLDSLDKVRALPVEQALAGHRENTGSFIGRINAIKAHHMARLEDTLHIVAEHPGINGYDVASRMKWSIRTKNWQEFPPGQRWFAVGEAIAHIHYLVEEGRLVCTPDADGTRCYHIAR